MAASDLFERIAVMDAVEIGAITHADYSGLCWETTFKDSEGDLGKPPAWCRWCNQSDGAREMMRRNTLVAVYAYLRARAAHSRAMADELAELERAVAPEWKPIFSKVFPTSNRS